MALRAVTQSSALDMVTKQLVDELCTGRWAVGARIPGELALAEELAVSRPVVREAIRGLTRMGMLEPRQGAGTFVRSNANPEAVLEGFDTAAVREIFEVQMAYDVQAAGLAAARRTDEDLTRLGELLRLRNIAEDDRGDPSAFADVDADFHVAIVVAAKNPLLLELYRYFVVRLRESLHHVHADPAIPSCGHTSHDAIFTAIRAGDAAGAREAARLMIECSLSALDSAG
ncbi:FadR/GntR family transcriptional regulator [Amycolatopsis minnesotensis]|uniref:FadR/GntR family transcriptional regulator n=1 Tax=Amycolatopsis minnesotensis TaxID=337894 RepID=A0ABN2RMI8_9PSEU